MTDTDANSTKVVEASTADMSGASITRQNLASSRFFQKNHSLLSTQVDFKHVSKSAKMLKDLGWTSGFYLPFANKESRALERKVRKSQTSPIAATT